MIDTQIDQCTLLLNLHSIICIPFVISFRFVSACMHFGAPHDDVRLEMPFDVYRLLQYYI